jgi:hypothetical protein
MQLKGVDGMREPRITFAGYEFSNNLNDASTANWLEVDISVQTPHGWGTSRVACMHTWDALSLADWFDTLGAQRPVGELEMLFPEPNLQFRVAHQTAREITFHVGFILERPGQWQMDDAHNVDSSNYVGEMDLTMSYAALLTASESLRVEVQNFPIRKAESL